MIWENLDIFIYSVIASIVAIIFVRIHARKLRENDGKHLPVLNISIAILFVLPLLTFLFGGVKVGYETPELKQLAETAFKFEGGLSIPPELLSLVIALSLYTATYVAECVRAVSYTHLTLPTINSL